MTDRPALEDLDTVPEPARWCCDGNAEDCPLCDTTTLLYPWICPGHPDTAANRQQARAATEPAVSETAEVQRLRRMIRQIMTGNRAAVDRLTDAHQATIGELRRAEARVREVQAALDAIDGEPAAPGTPVRHVHVTITHPDEFTANRAALSLVDWVRAEFGDSLTLDVTTDAREWDASTEEQP